MVSSAAPLPKQGDLSDSELSTWLDGLQSERDHEDLAALGNAVRYAAQLHQGESTPDGQTRVLALCHTAQILHELKLDRDSLIVAVLSDTPFAPAYDEDYIRNRFGKDVSSMLRLMSRIRSLSVTGVKDMEEGAENLRRLLLGMTNDVRALLIVLAKRLRIMRGLKNLPRDLQIKLARETMRLHAPLANRLGIWQLKWELEDLCLRYLEPEGYEQIASQLDGKRRQREAFIADVEQRLKRHCAEHGIELEISGRPKHIYSIWKKMQRKGVGFEQIFDVRALRVLVDSISHCYEVLGIVHGLWTPVVGEFDDYIAKPKGNGYRSLHTAVIGEDGKPIEIQIRTFEMHELSERGVAAHWRYKESAGEDAELERRIEWMRRWLDQKGGEGDETEIGDADPDFEASRIYVLTPQGKVIELPRGATAIDFAYAIHSSIGHRCRGARVDGRMTSLTQPLESGQMVEINTVREGGPSRDWLNPHAGYVVTARARNRIRHWFKQQDHDAHVHAGRQLLEREIIRLGIGRPDLDKALRKFNLHDVDDLLAAIGSGEVSAIQVVNLHQPTARPRADREIPEKAARRRQQRSRRPGGQVIVEGVGELMTTTAKCCKPVPYDPITGYITRGRGVTVHRSDCPVVTKMSDEQRSRLIGVHWDDAPDEAAFLADIVVYAGDRKGLLRDITSVFANEEIDVLGVSTQSDRHQERADMRFTVEVSNLNQLSRVLEKLSQVPEVLDVRRKS